MITNKTVYAVEPIVEGFIKRNQIVAAIPGTPLAAVCETMHWNQPPEDADALVQLSAERMVVAETLDETEDGVVAPANEREVYIHDEVLQTAVQDVVEKVVYAKELARNTILPKCRALYPELEKRIDSIILAPKLIPTVSLSYYPEFYNSEEYQALVSDYDLDGLISINNDFTPTEKLAFITGDKLRTLLYTGNENLDRFVQQATEGMSDQALEDIYNHFFRGSAPSSNNTAYLITYPDSDNVAFHGSRAAATPAFLCYMWAVNLLEDIQDGNDMMLENYRAKMQQARAAAINGMARVGRDRILRMERGELILSAPSASQIQRAEDASAMTIFVNADVYMGYLQEGGSPEALTAAVLLERELISKDELLANGAGFMQHYRNYINMKASQQAANRLRAYALALQGVFADLITVDLDEDTRKKVMEIVRGEVATLTDTDVANFQQYFRTLYVKTMHHEDAQGVNRLIDEIDLIMRERPELTVFEAATIATMHLTTDYVAQQLYVIQISEV